MEVACRQYFLQRLLVIGLQASQCVGLGFAVDVEERLELAQHAVLFVLHNFRVFVDGKIEGCNQLSVLPRLAGIKLIVELAVAGHKVDDNSYRCDENENFV